MTIVPNCLIHVPNFFSRSVADEVMKDMMKDCRADFSPTAGEGRSMARYGATYTYQGRPLKIYPWRDVLVSLKEQVQAACASFDLNVEFNAAVLNLYKDEKTDLPLHADTRAIHQLGKEPVIACISLGSARPFQLVEKKTGKEQRFDLGHGDLYIMHGVSQSQYLHGAPAVERILLPRVSVTFRHHKE